jgi:hypothetical protein
MRCVILRNRGRTPVTLQLSSSEDGALPHLHGVKVPRLISEIDPASGQPRFRDVVVNTPPSVTIQAGGVSEPLPHAVLKIPQIRSLVSVQKVLVVAEEREV